MEAVREQFPDFGDTLLVVPLDVTDPDSIQAAPDAAVERFGRIDVLVNNAGTGLLAAVEESDDAAVRSVFETNVFGPFAVQRALVEPGFFRTDFLDPASLNSAIDVIDDYGPTAGVIRLAVPGLDHAQPGDPVKAAHAIVEIVTSPEPPLRLQLGTDTLQAFDAKLDAFRKEMDAWQGDCKVS
ncbi:SDR family NAD(P)-dependent oxidoreductase [Streptomyces sp. NBC_00696]|uniref:SDR family NAD(P)-dependent oxidoreductase n=1 Tax=Streptomyces sp. NBC_00696 TaxID=2903672 RepID=UPI002E3561B4|nr:SDR family NAD(P)-dependent oxidoreductase [Streptomyces sp. NBC_00696]